MESTTELGTAILFSTCRRHGGLCIADRIMVSSACWKWTGATDRNGYGQVSVNGRKTYVHRLVYEALVGPIPVGLDIDHLCRNPICCKPGHLEPVTRGENARRGLTGKYQSARTHCNHGHEFTPENTAPRYDSGYRRCRECTQTRNREYQRVKREERKAAT